MARCQFRNILFVGISQGYAPKVKGPTFRLSCGTFQQIQQLQKKQFDLILSPGQGAAIANFHYLSLTWAEMPITAVWFDSWKNQTISKFGAPYFLLAAPRIISAESYHHFNCICTQKRKINVSKQSANLQWKKNSCECVQCRGGK